MTPSSYGSLPFGDPNASDRSDIESTYVDVTEVLSTKYFGLDDITKTKIVVGRKGSGKTHLLKKIEILSKKQSQECEFIPLRNDIFVGKGIRTLRGDLTPEETTVFWAELWKIAFLLSALSLFYCKRPDKAALSAIKSVDGDIFVSESEDYLNDFRHEMQDAYHRIAWKQLPRSPLDPITALSEILKRYTNLNSINNDLRSNLNIRDLENDVNKLLHHYGHVHYIIDGLDELAWADLTGWLDVQRGLFKCAFLLSGVGRSTQYLKTTISVRNYVYNRSTQDPNADRIDAQLLKLNWDDVASEKFLNQRLRSANGGKFARSDRLKGERPFSSWLGFEEKQPDSRGVVETVERYLLRHTRLSPRNIVDSLNHIAKAINEAEVKQQSFNEVDFAKVVAEIARDVAKKMLVTTAEEIVATIPGIERKLASDQGNVRVQGEFIINFVAEELEVAISMMETEVISKEKFNSLLDLIIEFAIGKISVSKRKQLSRDIEGILWRSGLIAYKEKETDSKWKYSWADGEFGFSRPSIASDRIGFHSSLIDLCGLGVVENAPIF